MLVLRKKSYLSKLSTNSDFFPDKTIANEIFLYYNFIRNINKEAIMVNTHNHHANIPSPGLVLSEALINVQINLRLTQKDLSEIIHASPATICRYAKGQAINPDSAEGQLAMYFIRIYRSLNALFGGNDTYAREWLINDNLYFNAKPLDLIKDLPGLYEVLVYLDAMRGLA